MIESEDDLNHLPSEYIVLGGGSNALISPNIKKVLIKVSTSYCKFQLDDDGLICSAGATVSNILKWLSKNHLSGLEFAAGVPATIGGMVFMNFECWGYEISSIVHSVQIYTKETGIEWIAREKYEVGYRWTSFHEKNCIILAVKLKVTPATAEEIKSSVKENIDYRKDKQPLYNHTFGSVFKNPLPKKAGQLIDKEGLKGMSINGAKISEHHANFIENINSATFDDTIALIRKIQQIILEKKNINLECEVQIIK